MLLNKLPDFMMLKIVAKRFLKKTLHIKNKRDSDFPQLGKQLIPPGVTSSVFNGFVTSETNQCGLQVSIHHDQNGGVSCSWHSSDKFEGYPQTLHGGISFAILDELLAYAIFEQYATFAVTISSQTNWHGRIKIGSTIYAKALVKKRFWRFVRVKGKILNEKGRVVVSMNALFYIPTKPEFKKLIDLSIMPPEALPFCGID